MSSKHIEVPVIEGTRTTMPVDEAKRLAASEIQIEIADEKDAYRIVRPSFPPNYIPIPNLTQSRPKASMPVSRKTP